MALHERLWPDLVKAIRREPVTPLKNVRGSINYRLMNWATWYISDPAADYYRSRLLKALQDMESIGHLSMEGPGGIGTECGAPGMHWSFNFGAVVGAFQAAYERDDSSMISAGLSYLINEFGLNGRYRLNGWVCFPCPRVKDEKRQKPLDGNRDLATKLAFGEPVKKSAKFWTQNQNTAVAAFRRIMSDQPALAVRFRNATEPPCYLRIHRVALADGGYLAYIERTPASEAAMGKDCCNWTLCQPSGYEFGFDWEPLPEVA